MGGRKQFQRGQAYLPDRQRRAQAQINLQLGRVLLPRGVWKLRLGNKRDPIYFGQAERPGEAALPSGSVDQVR